MVRAHKIRLQPTATQEVILRKTVGASRFAYNWAFSEWCRWYDDFKSGIRPDQPDAYKLLNRWTVEKPEWANETGSVAQRRAILNLGKAFKNFFRGKTHYPRLKKRSSSKDAFSVSTSHARVDGRWIVLPKTGRVRMREPLRYSGKILQYSVSHYAGEWHVSIQVEIEVDPSTPNPAVAGVDVGLKSPAVASDGSTLKLPGDLSRKRWRLIRAQKRMAKKVPGSRNYSKALLGKQKIQNKINNTTSDCIHKFTAAVAKNHGTVVIESLNIRAMRQSPIRNIRAGFQRSCMGETLRQIRYKAGVCVEAPMFFPSTQLCSCCGERQKMPLEQRVYNCPSCGSTTDRDLNAALNLQKYVGVVTPDIKPVETVDHERGNLLSSGSL